jgi:hypothetical protein
MIENMTRTELLEYAAVCRRIVDEMTTRNTLLEGEAEVDVSRKNVLQEVLEERDTALDNLSEALRDVRKNFYMEITNRNLRHIKDAKEINVLLDGQRRDMEHVVELENKLSDTERGLKGAMELNAELTRAGIKSKEEAEYWKKAAVEFEVDNHELRRLNGNQSETIKTLMRRL